MTCLAQLLVTSKPFDRKSLTLAPLLVTYPHSGLLIAQLQKSLRLLQVSSEFFLQGVLWLLLTLTLKAPSVLAETY